MYVGSLYYINRRNNVLLSLLPGWTLHNFTVAVLPNKNPQRICKIIDREIATGETIYIGCLRPVQGNQVMLFSNNEDDVFTLCEVAIYGKQVSLSLRNCGRARRCACMRAYVRAWSVRIHMY